MYTTRIYKISVLAQRRIAQTRRIVAESAISAGAAQSDIAEAKFARRHTFEFFTCDSSRAQKYTREIQQRGLSAVIEDMRPHDWQDASVLRRPIMLLPGMRVVPQGSAQRPGDIALETGLVFGDGLHPTTRGIARFLWKRRNTFTSFYDIGTGTGILSIVAARCGARIICAIDIDAHAVAVARRNMALCGYRFRQCRRGDIGVGAFTARFDFVAANLYTHDLISHRDRIAAVVTPGGYLAVSGVSASHAAQVIAEFSSVSLRRVEIIRQSAWAAVLFQKPL